MTEAEEALCRESAQAAQQATEAQEAMDQHYKAKWRQAEADLTALCQSNSAQAQPLAAKLQETNMEHHELYTAQERQLRLEAQALRQAQEQEQQAAQVTQEHEFAIQELRRQAEEQPAIQKTLWKRQLLQQSTYKAEKPGAEIHELKTEMLNMREKSEMQSHLAANMCKLEHSVPSSSVESEPENVLNTRSPGRCSRWILPEELETPNRPTSSGLQSQIGAPVQLGPSPQTREYSPVIVHVVYLQLNGETCMLENKETKNVNCSEKYLQDVKQTSRVCSQMVKSSKMSWTMQPHHMRLTLWQLL